MKLKNKKTGEIGILAYFVSNNIFDTNIFVNDENGIQLGRYTSLAELNEEWEDYEEPKYWYISDGGEVYGFNEYFVDSQVEDDYREIGNLFETKEEAELAVRKLKAWKRLKDKGFRIRRNNYNDGMMYLHIWNDTTDEPTPLDKNSETFKDLDLLFGWGGEE